MDSRRHASLTDALVFALDTVHRPPAPGGIRPRAAGQGSDRVWSEVTPTERRDVDITEATLLARAVLDEAGELIGAVQALTNHIDELTAELRRLAGSSLRHTTHVGGGS